jgi:nitrogen fixation negative regulator NifL
MKNSYPATRNKTDGERRRGNGQCGPDHAADDIFHILAENSSDMIAHLRLAPEFQVLYVSPSICRITGYTPDECYETPGLIHRCIHPEDAGRLEHLLDPDSPYGREPAVLRWTRKDGTSVWVEHTKTVVRDAAAGAMDGYFICRDVTARRLTEDALKESQKFISSLLENAPHATVVINPDTSIRYVNPVWEETNGWRLHEVIGVKAPYPWWPEEQRQVFADNFKLAMKQGSGKGEVVAVKKNGERYWIAMNWTTISDGGEKQYMLVNSLDITERKRAEELREAENRILTLLGQGAELKGLLEAIVRLGEARDPSIRGSVLLLDPAKGMLFPAAGPSLPEEYMQLVVNGVPIGEGIAACGTAAHRKQRVIVPDINNSPLFQVEAVKAVTGRNNMLACWAQPFISSKGELLGTIANYANRVGEPDAQNLAILEWSARIAAIAVEHKRAEEQVRLLGSVTEQISEATVIADPDFKITYVNRAAQDLFGYTPEEALGKRLGLFNDKPISKRYRRKIMDIMSTGRVWSGVATKRRKDGSQLLCDCRLSPLQDENGRTIAYIDVDRDVTEQKEMERKLQEHKTLIENILASLPEGVMVTDGRDKVVLANAAFHRIFHLARKTVKTRPFPELLRIPELYELYRSVRQGAAADTLELRYRARGQEKIICCAVIRMDRERMLLIFSDVSKEREDKEKLYLTDRLATIGEMAAGLAHELNNPLTAILTLSQLLLHHGLPGESQEDMQCIYDEAQRATRIVKNVLLFARNNNYEHGQSSVNDVVRDVLRLRRYDQKTSNITAETNLAEGLPDIPVDRFQLQQVFLNIVLNAEAAIKETGRPGLLTVTTEMVNDRVKIHFADNGCGIKKSVMPRIFDPFFTTKDIGKGTGLGLSICYGIVVKHGGRISVRSQAGAGATFTIEMPIFQP